MSLLLAFTTAPPVVSTAPVLVRARLRPALPPARARRAASVPLPIAPSIAPIARARPAKRMPGSRRPLRTAVPLWSDGPMRPSSPRRRALGPRRTRSVDPPWTPVVIPPVNPNYVDYGHRPTVRLWLRRIRTAVMPLTQASPAAPSLPLAQGRRARPWLSPKRAQITSTPVPPDLIVDRRRARPLMALRRGKVVQPISAVPPAVPPVVRRGQLKIAARPRRNAWPPSTPPRDVPRSARRPTPRPSKRSGKRFDPAWTAVAVSPPLPLRRPRPRMTYALPAKRRAWAPLPEAVAIVVEAALVLVARLRDGIITASLRGGMARAELRRGTIVAPVRANPRLAARLRSGTALASLRVVRLVARLRDRLASARLR